MKRHIFSLQKVTTSDFRDFINKLKGIIIRIIRIFFDNFRKQEVHQFLNKDKELEAYNSFVEVLSLSYNPEKPDK